MDDDDSSVKIEVSEENPQPAVHSCDVTSDVDVEQVAAAARMFPTNDGAKDVLMEKNNVVEKASGTSPTDNEVIDSPMEEKDTIESVIDSAVSSASHYISTLVFFDVETTGLPRNSKDNGVQITEISMIAVSREDFETCECVEDLRVFNKLSLCIRPRCRISPVAAEITGLSNCNLVQQKTFDKRTGLLISNFMMRLPEPYCLLAHNGNRFDFRLLKAELGRLKITMPHNTYTADTLKAFRSFKIFSSAADNKKKGDKKKKTCRKRPSYSLANLYQHFHKKLIPNNHKCDGDWDALLRICHKVKNNMLPWIDKNKMLLSSISYMW